jgi:hypothetical protein
LGSGCARQGEKRCKWFHCDLLVLLGREGEEKKYARAQNTAVMMWRPADGSGGRGARGGGQQGRARAVGDVQATRGEGGSRRWSGGACTAATARGSAPAAETAGVQRGPEEEEKREGSEGPMCKTKRF